MGGKGRWIFEASLVYSQGYTEKPCFKIKKKTLSHENRRGRERREDRLELATTVGRMLA